MRLKTRIFNFNYGNKVAILLLLIFLCTLFILNSLKIEITTILKDYATNEVTNISTYIINEAVNEVIDEKIDSNELIEMAKNSKEEIISVDFNTLEVNKVLVKINNSVLKSYKTLENGDYTSLNSSIFNKEKKRGGFLYYIPLGVVNKNPLLAELGPKIPIKATVIGNIVSNIKTELTPYGINNTLLKIYIEVKSSVNFVMPFVSENVVVEEQIPIVIKLINGSIPDVYGGNYAVNSPLSTS